MMSQGAELRAQGGVMASKASEIEHKGEIV